MSTEVKYSLEDVLAPHELNKLGNPEKIEQIPSAQAIHWEDNSAVTAPGIAIAASMDRLKAGNLTPSHKRTLKGFQGEFGRNGERVAYTADEIRDILGDQVIARTQLFGKSVPLKLRSPEEAIETIRKYDRNYAGSVEDDFWTAIDARNVVYPVSYGENGVIPEAGITLSSHSGLVPDEEELSYLLEDVEKKEDNGLLKKWYLATDEEKAEYMVEIEIPPGADNITHELNGHTLTVSGEDSIYMHNFKQADEVIDYGRNNGVYWLELG